MRILIAEDSPTQSAQLVYLLEQCGFSVTAARDGREALEMLDRVAPALVITDVVMPGLDGYGLCKAIKAEERWKHIPVMLVTTLSDPEDVIRGLGCGADNFVRKPYDERYLLSRIDYLLMNVELRKNQKVQIGVEISLGGQRHFITSDRQQILDLLISTYEQAVQINEDLKSREKDLSHANEVLTGLYRIADALNQAESERQVAELALERALDLPGIEGGWLFLRDGADDFRLAAARNVPSALLRPDALEGDCLCRRELLAGGLPSAANIVDCERLATAAGEAGSVRYHVSVPLRLGDRTLGIMNLIGAQDGAVEEDELTALHNVGNQVAVALDRTRLHEHLETLVQERTASLEAEIAERKRIEEQLREHVRTESALAELGRAAMTVTSLQAFFDEACRLAAEGLDIPVVTIGGVVPEDSGLSTPIPGKGGPCGVIAARTDAQREFSEGDARFLQSFANLVGTTIERAQAQESLQHSEALLHIATRLSRMGAWAVDLPEMKLTWSHETAVIHEVPPGYVPTVEETIRFYAPGSRQAIREAFEACVREGTPYDLEAQIITAKGRHVWVRAIGDAERDAEGVIHRVHGALQDITDQRKAREQIIEQAALIDQASDAIILRDLEHHVLFWSKGAERLYGWAAADVLGQRADDLLRVDAATFDSAVAGLLDTGSWKGEMEMATASGSVLTVDSRWTLLRDDQGDPKGYLTLDTDVTERKKLEQQFLRAQRLESIGTLAGGIAHDLNNLLMPILMGVALIRRYEPSEACQRAIDNIQRSAERGRDLVKQVLSFARGVEGSRIPVHAGDVVNEIRAMVETTFPKNISLRVDVADDLWWINADPTQLNQVILNLCVNARDAMPNGGRLSIFAHNVEIDEHYALMQRGIVAGQYVVLEVADTGSGMPPRIVDRIFDPFFTTKESGKGTGLGLSTVAAIVRSHGGYVNVYSELGKGSTFKVSIPAQQQADRERMGTEAAAEKLPRGNGELIMVVDDDPTILSITEQTLEAFGYRVITAEDGAQAIGLYALRRGEIAVVMTDMMMPVMDGPALASALRRIDPDVRIIGSSGLDSEGYQVRAAMAGVRHFLAKPYTAEDMLRMLNGVV